MRMAQARESVARGSRSSLRTACSAHYPGLPWRPPSPYRASWGGRRASGRDLHDGGRGGGSRAWHVAPWAERPAGLSDACTTTAVPPYSPRMYPKAMWNRRPGCPLLTYSIKSIDFPLLTQDVPKVDVEQAPICGEQQVVQVPVAHPQHIGHHAAPRAAAHEVAQYFWAQPKRACKGVAGNLLGPVGLWAGAAPAVQATGTRSPVVSLAREGWPCSSPQGLPALPRPAYCIT